MTLDDILKDYILQTEYCYKVNYSDKKSIVKNNKAVDKMYKLVSIIEQEFGEIGQSEFAKLLELKQNNTNLWCAIHLLEKFEVRGKIYDTALNIIKIESENSFGMEIWLKNYLEKKI